MGLPPYERPHRLGPVERGHRPDCVWTNNFGLSCSCDGSIGRTPEAADRRKQIIRGMELSGWTFCNDSHSETYLHFERAFGSHRISVSRVASGWQLVWIRGSGWTILEEGNYGTIEVCIASLFEHMVAYHDMADGILAENVRMKLEAAKAHPRLTLVPEDPGGEPA